MVPKWLGPYEIVDLKDKLAQLRNQKTQSIMANHINVDRLKFYKDASTQSGKRVCHEDDYQAACSEDFAKQEENFQLEEVSMENQDDSFQDIQLDVDLQEIVDDEYGSNIVEESKALCVTESRVPRSLLTKPTKDIKVITSPILIHCHNY